MKIEALNFYIDINGDGRYSSWEIWETVKWVYRLPGNLLIEGVGHVPHLSGWLGIQASEATGYASFNNWIAVGFSLLFWLSLLIFLASRKRYEGESDAAKPQHVRLPLTDNRKVKPIMESQRVHRGSGHGHMAGHPK